MLKEGTYLRCRFHGSYDSMGYTYERSLWQKEGLVYTEDGRALFREGAFYIAPDQKPVEVIDGIPLYQGPPPDLIPSEPTPWFPFCVDGRWGYASNQCMYSDLPGEVMVPPQWAFCDHFEGDYGDGYARFAAEGDIDLKRLARGETVEGRWGMYYYDFDICLPPVYQYLSNPQNNAVLAKKDGVWGALEACFDPDSILIPFSWDYMTFIKNTILARRDTPSGPRYALFNGCCAEWPALAGKLLLDQITTVTVPDRPRDDGLPHCCRLVERDGLWGVIDCRIASVLSRPELSRQEAEELFWEREDVCD